VPVNNVVDQALRATYSEGKPLKLVETGAASVAWSETPGDIPVERGGKVYHAPRRLFST